MDSDPKVKHYTYRWEMHTEPGKVEKSGVGDWCADGPTPPLPPPPASVDSVVPADVVEAWKVYDTMLIVAKGDRTVADQEFERVRTRKTKGASHGKDKGSKA